LSGKTTEMFDFEKSLNKVACWVVVGFEGIELSHYFKSVFNIRLLENTFEPILKLGVKRDASNGECFNVSKKIADGPNEYGSFKRRKKVEKMSAPMNLINMRLKLP
jgi:hypothetical protein